eukprot:CAMPEP_0202410714 /NCGR_PEP_ID=MMETSP1128-20130828/19811_1 /ASSEMBLY_ACC=CAM_ASM_000463 /TAXON_ID=3047 /ORGANISM="Dunaliella tertiolecta, Strain CCMP1320" /LENGTH=94 /DNA_ID=CAMNT_0049016277 /DNA_START=218 /DNA_END=498 /DNA_ORIENTATION=-
MPLACHPLLVLAAQLIVASSVAHCLVTAHLEAYIEAYIAAAAAAAASAASAAAPNRRMKETERATNWIALCEGGSQLPAQVVQRVALQPMPLLP